MAEGLGLRLRGWGSDERGLSLSRGVGRRQEGDLFAYGPAEVLERLLDIGWVVVGLVGVLRTFRGPRSAKLCRLTEGTEIFGGALTSRQASSGVPASEHPLASRGRYSREEAGSSRGKGVENNVS